MSSRSTIGIPRLPSRFLRPYIRLLHDLPDKRPFCFGVRLPVGATFPCKAIFQRGIVRGVLRGCAEIVSKQQGELFGETAGAPHMNMGAPCSRRLPKIAFYPIRI